jgi:hypothetical protein
MRLMGLGVSPGVGIGRALVLSAAHAICASACLRRSSAVSSNGSIARARSREQIQQIKGGSPERPAPITPICSTRSS